MACPWIVTLREALCQCRRLSEAERPRRNHGQSVARIFSLQSETNLLLLIKAPLSSGFARTGRRIDLDSTQSGPSTHRFPFWDRTNIKQRFRGFTAEGTVLRDCSQTDWRRVVLYVEPMKHPL